VPLRTAEGRGVLRRLPHCALALGLQHPAERRQELGARGGAALRHEQRAGERRARLGVGLAEVRGHVLAEERDALAVGRRAAGVHRVVGDLRVAVLRRARVGVLVWRRRWPAHGRRMVHPTHQGHVQESGAEVLVALGLRLALGRRQVQAGDDLHVQSGRTEIAVHCEG